MTELESKIIEQIIQAYKNQGVNPRKIMDNPIFLHLPLASKIEVIKQYSLALRSNPETSAANTAIQALKSGLSGAVLSAGISGLSQKTKLLSPLVRGPKGFNSTNLAYAAGIGASLGIIKSLVFSQMKRMDDQRFSNMVANNSPETVLGINYTTGKLNPESVNSNPIISQLSLMNNVLHGEIHRG
jgi:hypothetical protein